MRTCVVALVLLILPSFALADVIHLKDGTRLEGEIKTMDEAEIKIRLPYGTLTVKREDIQRIEFGAHEEEPEKEPEPVKIEEPEKKEPEPPKVEEPQVEPYPIEKVVAKPRGRKSPATAAGLAIVPGGGYVYLRRWDLALAAAGAEGGLAAWGVSLLSDDEEGNDSTAYVVLGFAGLIKVIEVFDSYDKAVEWNRPLGLEVGQSGESFFLGLTASF